MTRQHAGWCAILLVCATVSVGSGAVASAATVRGAPITVSAVDDAGATVADQQRLGVGRIAAMAVGGFGILMLLGGKLAPGLMATAGGFGSAFIPAGISSAFDAAPAADGLLAPVTPWLAVLQGFVGDHLVYEPVFLVCLVGSLLYVRQSRRETAALV